MLLAVPAGHTLMGKPLALSLLPLLSEILNHSGAAGPTPCSRARRAAAAAGCLRECAAGTPSGAAQARALLLLDWCWSGAGRLLLLGLLIELLGAGYQAGRRS